MDQSNHYYSAIDIGTTKIRVITGIINNEKFQVKGYGEADSTWVEKGTIRNTLLVQGTLIEAVQKCQNQCGYEIEEFLVGISGHNIIGINQKGGVGVKTDMIDQEDINRVVDNAIIHSYRDKEILHVIPEEYIVDGASIGTQSPIGMNANKLEAKVHLTLADKNQLSLIRNCCSGAGIKISAFLFNPIASALTLLTKEETETGVVFIDIGAGTTDFVVIKNGGVIYSDNIEIAGKHITNDIAYGLKVPKEQAEHLKKQYGSAISNKFTKEKTFKIQTRSEIERIISYNVISQIIEARLTEILRLIKNKLEHKKLFYLCNAGVVIAGGETLLTDFTLLTSQVLHCYCRIAQPTHIEGIGDFVVSPEYSTIASIIKFSSSQSSENKNNFFNLNQIYSKNNLNILDMFKKFF